MRHCWGDPDKREPVDLAMPQIMDAEPEDKRTNWEVLFSKQWLEQDPTDLPQILHVVPRVCAALQSFRGSDYVSTVSSSTAP